MYTYNVIANIVGAFLQLEKFPLSITLTLKILLGLGRMLWSTHILGLRYD